MHHCAGWLGVFKHRHYYTVSQKNNTNVAQYNFDTHRPILVIFGSDVAERVFYQMVFVISSLLTNVSPLPGET